VEHRCQQCGTTVEDGRPFCPQCRAPQISVKVAIVDAEVAPGLNHPPDEASPDILRAGHFDRPRLAAGVMDRRSAVRAAIKAGLLGVFIGMIPVLGIVLTGALAVFFYRREIGFVLPAALGARLGGAAGIVVFAVNALFTIPIIVFHAQQECIDTIIKAAQKYGINTTSPQFQATVHDLFTPSGLAINFLALLVLASIGGALASLFMRSGSPRM
jgi:hypothetical protein